MKKWIKRVLVFSSLILIFLIAMLVSYLSHVGIWGRFKGSLGSFSLWWLPLVFIIGFFLTLTLHELTHLVLFKIKGHKIRGLFVTIFSIYRDFDFKWKITINLQHASLLGGFVVPSISGVESDDDYRKIRSDFSASLIAAPLVTIAFAILTVVIFVLLLFLTESYLAIALSFWSMIVTLVFSTIYTISSTLNTKNMYGDFVAFRKMKNDDLFALTQLSQYNMFSETPNRSSEFYYNKIINYFVMQHQISNLFEYSLVAEYIEMVMEQGKPSIDELDQKILKINFIHVANHHGYGFGHILIRYQYYLGYLNEANENYRKISALTGDNPKETKYFMTKTSHLLGLTDERAYLNDSNNVYISDMKLFGLVYDFIGHEQKTNEPIVPLANHDKVNANTDQ